MVRPVFRIVLGRNLKKREFLKSLARHRSNKNERFALSKRSLMLTAATVALLSGHAYAQFEISNKVTTPQSTMADKGTIDIETDGSIVITTNPATGPAVTIDGGTTPGSAADVYNQGTISYAGVGSSTNPLTGIEMLGGSIGGLDNAATIDFTGAGTNKTGILVAAGTGAFIGDIMCTEDSSDCSGDQNSKGTPLSQLVGILDTNVAAILLESGSTMKIQGDDSIGIDIQQGATLGGTCTNCASDIDIAGELEMTPSSSASTSSSDSGIYLAGTMYGNINVAQGGQINIQGINSIGINIIAPDTGTNTPGGILNGVNTNIMGATPDAIVIDGIVTMTSNAPASVTEGNNIAMYLGGTINGNVDIGTDGTVSSAGEGAEGIVVAGPINGAIENQNLLSTYGISTPSNAGDNPQAGSALIINASVTGGILNAGPLSENDTTDPSATISTGGNTPTIVISPTSNTTSSITIGPYMGSGSDVASLINRGEISNGSGNPDPSTFTPTAIEIEGISSSFETILTNGIFNSGSITSTAFTDTNGASTDSAIGILIGQYAEIDGGLTNSNEVTSRPGDISATISGAQGGRAIAIDILDNGYLPSIVNDGTIIASATTTNTKLENGAVQATAILDGSGTLDSIINNTGADIEAFATTLKDGSQIAIAMNLETNTTGVNIQNMGTIYGDIDLGSGNDTVSIEGTGSSTAANMFGNLYFGGNNALQGSGVDSLIIGAYGTFTGQVYSGSETDKTLGLVDIEVQSNGTFNMLTADSASGSDTQQQTLVEGTTLNAGTFDLNAGSTVDIHFSQAFNLDYFPTAVIVDAQTEATIASTNVSFTPDSFIVPAPGDTQAQFVIVESPNLSIPSLSQINTAFLATLSYLYDPTPGTSGLAQVGDELVLTLQPKTIGADGCKTQQEANNCNLAHIPLSGYAAELFPYVNQALGNDNALGSAMIRSILNSYDAQNDYTNFAPDVSGATRAQAISLTDDATSIVAARQKELREYANQDGDLTLWGQQVTQSLDQTSTSSGPGYRTSGFGFALGADEGDPVDGRYGGAFTFFSGDSRETDPGNSKTRSEWYMLTAYSDWRGKGLFLDTDWTAGYVSLTGNRYLNLEVPQEDGDFSDFFRDAYEHHPGEFLSGGVTTGAVFDESGTVFTPQLSLNGLTMREEPYVESGGGNGMDLGVSSAYEQSLRAYTGVDVRQDFDFTDFLLQPDIQLGYRYDFANGAQSLRAQFESVTPPSVFTISGPQPDKGNAVAQGGIAVSTGAWSLGLSFDYLRTGSNNTAEQGTITLLGRI